MKPSICIIDDDELYKLLLKKTISRLDGKIPVSCFSNGLEAIKNLKREEGNPNKLPDILLLDINMPVMDGWEFMDSFLSLKSNLAKPITIYIASSSIAQSDIQKAKDYAEISDYLIKPITSETIKSILKA